jgi:ParB family chromosome partitioning protein
LIENIQREDLNPVDVAQAYQRLIEELRLTQEEVAKKVGKNRTTVTNFLRLLKLPSQILESLRAETISMGHARALLGLENPEDQLVLWKKAVTHRWSVREVEAHVRKQNRPPKRFVPEERAKSPHIEALEEKLRDLLGTKVKIRPQGNRGKIEIDYYSQEDLERIWEILSGEGE